MTSAVKSDWSELARCSGGRGEERHFDFFMATLNEMSLL